MTWLAFACYECVENPYVNLLESSIILFSKNDVSLSSEKKTNVVPVRKKVTTTVKKWPCDATIAYLWKNFERLLYNSMLEFFMENTLILPHHSGFKTVDSSINLLLSITHEIYILFYDGYEVKGIFLDISNLKYGIQIFSIN